MLLSTYRLLYFPGSGIWYLIPAFEDWVLKRNEGASVYEPVDNLPMSDGVRFLRRGGLWFCLELHRRWSFGWIRIIRARPVGYYCPAVYCEEKLATLWPFDGCYAVWFGLESVSFFVICLFCIALYIYFSGRAMGAVGNAAELPGWLARVHEVLIDMFDTLFFCMINLRIW